MSSTNFQIWNPAQNNMLNDTDYSNDTMRLNGAVAEIYPSDLHNKMMFQVTTFLKAFSDSLVNQGYTLNDSNYINLVNTYSTLVNTQGSKMSGALEFANPSSITSVSGVLSLTNTSNTFIANGSETITTITGGQLSQGWYLITWNTARTLTNSATLQLLGNSNRTTAIGDTGIYQIVSNGAATPVFTVTELFYEQASPINIISTNTTLYVATTGSDSTGDGTSGNPWATIAKAINYLKNKWINSDVLVTIQLGDGLYTSSSPVSINHPCGNRILIIGENTYQKTVNSINGTPAGSSGNWSIVLNMSNVTNISIGDYIVIGNTSGGTNPSYLCGFHEITNVAGSTITILSKHLKGTYPSGLVTTSESHIVKTLLKFNNSNGVVIGNALGVLGNLGIIEGTALSGSAGLIKDTGNLIFNGILGISGFNYGIASSQGSISVSNSKVAASGSVVCGIQIAADSYLGMGNASTLITSGCDCGLYVVFSSSIDVVDVSLIISTGNNTNIKASHTSSMGTSTPITCTGAVNVGFQASGVSYINATGTILSGNTVDSSPAFNASGNANAWISN